MKFYTAQETIRLTLSQAIVKYLQWPSTANATGWNDGSSRGCGGSSGTATCPD